MSDKQIWKQALEPLHRTLEMLPDDVSICCLCQRGVFLDRHMVLQILYHPDMTPDVREPMDEDDPGGDQWCEQTLPIPVGWIEREDDE